VREGRGNPSPYSMHKKEKARECEPLSKMPLD